MGAVTIPDELQGIIERQVADGRAVSATSFVEAAIMRLIEDADAEQAAIEQAVERGSADIDAGRYTTVATDEDRESLRERVLQKMRAGSNAART